MSWSRAGTNVPQSEQGWFIGTEAKYLLLLLLLCPGLVIGACVRAIDEGALWVVNQGVDIASPLTKARLPWSCFIIPRHPCCELSCGAP
jgi:hypothetical protein